MELSFAAATDVGRQRNHNEDNFLIDKKLRLFMVADGMGGHAAGEVASSIAVHEIRDAVNNQKDLIDRYRVDHPGVQPYEILQVLEHAVQAGNPVSERLVPGQEDYFIIKPQFSGFYATNLPVLLPKLGVSRLIITGVATDICILFTAADAHMRDYALWVPEDAVAAADERGTWALEIMRGSMGAETRPTAELSIENWRSALDEKGIR